MDQTSNLILLIGAAGIGIAAILLIVRRQRRETDEATSETRFAASTEGEKRCPKCGMGNLWTDTTCVSCGSRLPG